MAGTFEDLVNEIAEEEEMEKNASEEVDALAEEVMARALEKVAEAKPKAEKDPEEMVEESEKNDPDNNDDGDKESAAEEAVEEEVEEELRGQKLSEDQKEKVASISEKFSSPEKKELFEKIASFQLLNNPRVVRDNNFQKYETLDGMPKEIKMLFDDEGQEVNTIE